MNGLRPNPQLLEPSFCSDETVNKSSAPICSANEKENNTEFLCFPHPCMTHLSYMTTFRLHGLCLTCTCRMAMTCQLQMLKGCTEPPCGLFIAYSGTANAGADENGICTVSPEQVHCSFTQCTKEIKMISLVPRNVVM